MNDASTSGAWYSDGLQFTCTQCGNCCGGAPGYVWVSPDEVRQIAAFLGVDVTDFETHHTRVDHRLRSLLEFENGDCEFLVRDADGKTRCSIHPVRPTQCRTWPFWQSNLTNRRAWQATGRSCPGLNHGQHHPLPVIQAALRENALAGLPL